MLLCLERNPIPRTALLAVALAGLPLGGLAAREGVRTRKGPLGPAEAAASFRHDPRLRLELVASEPTVVDPVALAFDASRRLYVVENRGYPLGPAGGEGPSGVIARLEDRDGDGRFEVRIDFARELSFPNGVLPWREGIFVTCAPDVLWLADTDGDGQADRREVVLTGFDAGNTTQLRVSHPTLGLDGKVYLTSGLTGTSRVRSPAHPGRAAVELRTDGRFDPFTREFEALDGRAQFGLSFDDFGRRFICMNRVHVRHVVLPSRYLRRNPRLAFAETVQDCPEAMVDDLLRGSNRAARIFPISDNVTTADSHAGTFSAACGVFVYRGDGLPAEYRGDVFACDPTGNLVHRDRLEPVGASFRARPAREGVEFLASTDNWFRPVNLASGPDGALYVCDMYRETIEHPRYLPEEIRKRTDFTSGRDRGRIWRLRDAVSRRPESGPGTSLSRSADLARADEAELVALLRDPDGWHRDTAHRLLLERRSPAAIDALRSLAVDRGVPVDASRAHALRLLRSHDALDEATLRAALSDPASGLREEALELSEAHFRRWPSLVSSILPLADDPDARVRFTAALVLGEVARERADRDLPRGEIVDALARVLLRDAPDRWARAAVLSSAAGEETELWRRLTDARETRKTDDEGFLHLYGELGRLLALGDSAPELARGDRPSIFAAEGAPVAERLRHLAALGGFVDGLHESRGVPSLADLVSRGGAGAVERLSEAFALAVEVARRPGAPRPARIAAARLLAEAGREQAVPVLVELIGENPHPDVVQAALRSLTVPRAPAGDGRDLVVALLAPQNWSETDPPTRELVLAALLARGTFLPGLLDAVEAGRVPVTAFSTAQRNRLLEHADAGIRSRAGKLFEAAGGGDRLAVFEAYRDVLALEPRPANGRRIFAEHCATCHRLDREGNAVGPDLFGVRNRPKEAILFHTLVPNAEIVPGFAVAVAVTRDGRVLTGIVTSESSEPDAVIRLLQPRGVAETFRRSSLLSLTPSGVSLMPDGFERSMSRQELADLIAYVKGEGRGATQD